MKDNKTETIKFRVTEKEKKKIQKYADKENKTVSEYILDVLLKRKNKKVNHNREQLLVYAAAIKQDDYNYIEMTYGRDLNFEEEVKKLWMSLQ